MKQVTYTGNDLAREVPTIREPKADDYTDFVSPDSAYYLALEAYGRHLASLQTIPVLPGHNWIIGQTYEEGRDYSLQYRIFDEVPGWGSEWCYVSREKYESFPRQEWKEILLYPIVKQAYCDAAGHYGGEPLRDGVCPKCGKHWNGDQPIVNDVASDSKASPSLDALINEYLNWHPTDLRMASAKHFTETGKVSGSLYLAIEEIAKGYYDLARIKEKMRQNRELLNSEQNPEGSDATPDPSSNEVDKK